MRLGAYPVWPLPDDNALHFAGVHQALMSERGLGEIWNFRGPTYNLYLVALNRAATTFVDFFSPRFDTVVRALHLGIIVGGAFTWARGLSARFSLSPQEAWIAGAIALLAGSQRIPLHAEDVAATLLLYVAGLTMMPRLGAHLAAGLLAGLLPFMKGITALYVGPVVLLASSRMGDRRLALVDLGHPGVARMARADADSRSGRDGSLPRRSVDLRCAVSKGKQGIRLHAEQSPVDPWRPGARIADSEAGGPEELEGAAVRCCPVERACRCRDSSSRITSVPWRYRLAYSITAVLSWERCDANKVRTGAHQALIWPSLQSSSAWSRLASGRWRRHLRLAVQRFSSQSSWAGSRWLV